MSTLTLTLTLAVLLILLALLGLGISYLLTGKSNYKLGSCGKDPNKLNRDDDCGTTFSCHLCKRQHENDKET